jgi:hypothetical protein
MTAARVTETEPMHTLFGSAPAVVLRRVLQADAALCAGFGAVLAVAAGLLGSWLGLSETLLRSVGIGLLPWAGFVLYAATRRSLTGLPTWVVIVGNTAWVVASAILLLSGQADPTALGYAFVIAVALLVALIAETQFMAVRRMRDE